MYQKIGVGIALKIKVIIGLMLVSSLHISEGWTEDRSSPKVRLEVELLSIDSVDEDSYSEALNRLEQRVEREGARLEEQPTFVSTIAEINGETEVRHTRLTRETLSLYKKKVTEWFSNRGGVYIQALTRAVVSGAFAGVAYVPGEFLLTVAIGAGVFSGSAQVFYKQYLRYITADSLIHRLIVPNARPSVAEKLQEAESAGRWLLIETAFLYLLKGVAVLEGVPFSTDPVHILKMAGSAFLTQGLLDKTVGLRRRRLLLQEPERSSQIERSASLQVLAIAAVTVALSAASLDPGRLIFWESGPISVGISELLFTGLFGASVGFYHREKKKLLKVRSMGYQHCSLLFSGI